MGIVEKLVYARRSRLSRAILLGVFGIDFPSKVVVGSGLQMPHNGMGTVVHPRTTVGNGVKIYHQVTVGRKDAHVPIESSPMERVVLEDNVVLFPGAKVLGGAGITTVGKGTLVAANAVLMNSTGENEIWAGVPARLVGKRNRI